MGFESKQTLWFYLTLSAPVLFRLFSSGRKMFLPPDTDSPFMAYAVMKGPP